MNQPLSWEDAQTLLAVSEHRSFSGAAKYLKLGQPTISRRIRKLEGLLNEQLFVRKKQGAVPTEVAIKLIPAAQQMARWAAEFNRSVMGTSQALSGVVRIAAPPGVAVEQLVQFAANFKSVEPDIQLEILASVDHLDLSRGDADIAIRTNRPTNPDLIALHSEKIRVGVFAAADYCKKISQPCTWQDLDWVTWAKPHEQVAPRPMLERLIPNFQPAFTSDNYLVQLAAVKAGLGAFIMDIPSAIDPSTITPTKKTNWPQPLMEIDMGISLPDSEFHFVCAKSLQFVPRVAVVAKAMILMLANNLKA